MKVMVYFYLALSFISIISATSDYYNLLGIGSDASKQEIKKAFKQLSLTYHPDKISHLSSSQQKEYAQIFEKAAFAYDILKNEETRKIYDEEGESAIIKYKKNKDKERQADEYEEIYSRYFKESNRNTKNDEEFFKNTDVIRLTLHNYTKLLNRNKIWMVLFYNYDDKNLSDILLQWKLFADKVDGIMTVAYVSCRFDEELCKNYDIKETPKVLFFGETETAKKTFKEYDRKHHWENYFTYASELMMSLVRVLNDDNYKEYLRDYPENYKVVLFTNKSYIPAKLKALSKIYHPDLLFGVVKLERNDPELISNFGFSKKDFPKLVVLNNGWNYSGEIYDKPWKLDQIKKFLDTYRHKRIKIDSKFYEFTADLQAKENKCVKGDSSTCAIIVIRKAKLSEEDNSYLKYLADRYLNDNITIGYVLLKKFKGKDFYSAYEDVDSDADLIIYRGKTHKYAAFSYMNHKEDFSHEASNYIDLILTGTGIFRRVKKDLIFHDSIVENSHEDL